MHTYPFKTTSYLHSYLYTWTIRVRFAEGTGERIFFFFFGFIPALGQFSGGKAIEL